MKACKSDARAATDNVVTAGNVYILLLSVFLRWMQLIWLKLLAVLCPEKLGH